MYITGLEANGLKELRFTHELQRCVLFTGPNFVGKSARLEAIRFALGHTPAALGYQNQALWQLASGTRMDAKVAFDDGSHAIRSLISDGGSVKQGREPIVPLWLEGKDMPMLNPEEYFKLTDSERIQYVFGMMKMPEAFTVDGIMADLRNLSLDENTEQTEKAKNDIIGIVKFKLDEGAGEPSLSIASALTELTREKGTLKTEFSIWNRRRNDTQGTLRVLSELKTREGECSADTLQGLEAELRRNAQQLEAANQESGALSQRQMQANRVALRRRQIEEELAKPIAEEGGDAAKLMAKIAELDAKLKKAKAAPPKEDVDALEAEWDNLVNAEHNLGIDEKHLAAEIESVNQGVEALKGQTRCPHCQSKGKDWKKNLSEAYTNQLAELVPKLATITDHTAALRKKITKAKTAWDKAKKACDARQELLNEQREAQSALDRIKTAQASAATRRELLQEELDGLKDAQPPSADELSTAASKVTELRQEHQRLTDRHSALVKLQQDLIRAGEAAEEHQIAAAKVAVIKAVGAKLKERQAEMIGVVFRDLMKVANYFTRDIMEHELVFNDGKIGYVKHGRFVSHKTFSGTEKALTYIAVTAALMREAPLRLVLLDEFDIDANVFPKVLNRLAAAVADGLIDQVIVAHTFTPDNAEWACKREWQHIALTTVNHGSDLLERRGS